MGIQSLLKSVLVFCHMRDVYVFVYVCICVYVYVCMCMCVYVCVCMQLLCSRMVNVHLHNV